MAARGDVPVIESPTMSTPFIVSLVGDIVLLRPIAASMVDAASAAVLSLLRDSDVAIGNCEVSAWASTTSDGPSPQAESGGVWLNAGPEAIEDLAALGFTMMSRANNHTGDFGVGGMEETDRLLSHVHIGHAGTGPTLAAARAPAIVQARAGRVGLVSATDTAPTHSVASHARADIKGRAGVNAIRTDMMTIVDATTFGVLEMAVQTSAAQGHPLGRIAPDGQTIRGLGAPIRRGERPATVITFDARDVEENIAQVRSVRQQADCVVFALHTHLAGEGADLPPDAVRRFAHDVIDAGADVVMGHGPHRVRGIEIYNGRPIFYSLGNFVNHVPDIGPQPADLYDIFGLDPRKTTFGELVALLSHTGGALESLLSDPTQWESIVARVVDDGPRRRIELHPIELASAAPSQPAAPRIARAASASRILDRIATLSAPFGTEIRHAGGIGVIEYSVARSAA
jgi:poly-gamma-glutamate capsule biosynthesis protein CapA/YwtB (metallophosphatase superfamily)